VTDRKSMEPAPQIAQGVVARAAARGLVIITCGIYGNVVRVMVPLNAPLETADEGLSILEHSIADTVGAQ
jgi:4-aminobutyrate aminotransferase / (S)-3-amino-2-methylpropionate transaminase / 5-aminovalerate transaminase